MAVSSLSSQALNYEKKYSLIQKFILDYPESKNDQRWAKILKLQRRIDELLSLEIHAQDRKLFRDRLEVELDKLAKIRLEIQSLHIPGCGSSYASLTTPIERTLKAVRHVNVLSEMIIRIKDVISLLK